MFVTVEEKAKQVFGCALSQGDIAQFIDDDHIAFVDGAFEFLWVPE